MSHELEFAQFSFGTQVRKSPYSDAALRWGAKGFSVYNHMYIPRDFGDPSENFLESRQRGNSLRRVC